jgi:hypothetical protein
LSGKSAAQHRCCSLDEPSLLGRWRWSLATFLRCRGCSVETFRLAGSRALAHSTTISQPPSHAWAPLAAAALPQRRREWQAVLPGRPAVQLRGMTSHCGRRFPRFVGRPQRPRLLAQFLGIFGRASHSRHPPMRHDDTRSGTRSVLRAVVWPRRSRSRVPAASG